MRAILPDPTLSWMMILIIMENAEKVKKKTSHGSSFRRRAFRDLHEIGRTEPFDIGIPQLLRRQVKIPPRRYGRLVERKVMSCSVDDPPGDGINA